MSHLDADNFQIADMTELPQNSGQATLGHGLCYAAQLGLNLYVCKIPRDPIIFL